MAMVVVDDSCLQADSQPKSGGLVWGSTAAWRCSTFIKMNRVNSRNDLWSWCTHCHGSWYTWSCTVHIVMGNIIIFIITVESLWWTHEPTLKLQMHIKQKHPHLVKLLGRQLTLRQFQANDYSARLLTCILTAVVMFLVTCCCWVSITWNTRNLLTCRTWNSTVIEDSHRLDDFTMFFLFIK